MLMSESTIINVAGSKLIFKLASFDFILPDILQISNYLQRL